MVVNQDPQGFAFSQPNDMSQEITFYLFEFCFISRILDLIPLLENFPTNLFEVVLQPFLDLLIPVT